MNQRTNMRRMHPQKTCVMAPGKQTQKVVRQQIRSIIDPLPLDYEFRSDILSGLLKFHPRQKASDMTGNFLFRHNHYGGGKLLHFENTARKWDSISWTFCLSNYCKGTMPVVAETLADESKTEYAKKEAFRLAIYSTTHRRQRFGELYSKEHSAGGQWVAQCAVCGQTGKCDMDHGQHPFADTLDNFLDSLHISLDQVSVTKQGTKWRLDDCDLSRAWQIFHDAKVEYQALCKQCHRLKTTEERQAKRQKVA